MKLMDFAAVILVIGLAATTFAIPSPKIEENEIDDRGFDEEDDGAWVIANKLLDDCGKRDMITCLGVKAVAVLDRASRMAKIKIVDGVVFVKSADSEDSRNGRALMTEEEIHNSLEQDPAGKTARLLDMLLDAATRFLQTHMLQFKMPDYATQPIQRALEEGRGKKKMLKQLLPIILGIGAKIVALIPLGIGAVGLLAGKALLVSKIALILAGIIAAQKFLGNRGGGGLGGLGGGSGWSSGGSSGSGWSSGNTGGWSDSSSNTWRSFDTAEASQKLAYKAQIPTSS